jgi:hypothetical protein
MRERLEQSADPMTQPAVTPESFAESARYLAEHPSATSDDLLELGLMSSGALLVPERILCNPVDADRLDLVEEFRSNPLGPYSEELRQLLWHLRAQTPLGRYVLKRVGEGRWRVLHLIGIRRPRGELVPGPTQETLEDAEWAIFALRWRDHTGCTLPSSRAVE